MEHIAHDDTKCTALASLQKLRLLEKTEGIVESHLPRSSIPQTSAERLARASDDVAVGVTKLLEADTIFYLAYGSNMCAETFLGVRSIRPLSEVNVSVPTLRLTLSLPGLPYNEPCFANVDFRKLPEKPKLPDPRNPIPRPPFEPPHSGEPWDGGLVGVAYEVTREDYRKIIATEGGGSSYKEIIVPCIPIPPNFKVPEHSPVPELPKPILARTLFAPYLPETNQPDASRSKRWWYRFVIPPHRPDPDYAQGSARYLKLITDGAREHELPENYQRYLQSLQPYTITSLRQKIGWLMIRIVWMPMVFFIFALSRLLADEDGKLPPTLATALTVVFNLQWLSYDAIFKPLFGDGERTKDERDDEGQRRRVRCRDEPADEEKVAFLSDTSR